MFFLIGLRGKHSTHCESKHLNLPQENNKLAVKHSCSVEAVDLSWKGLCLFEELVVPVLDIGRAKEGNLK